MKPRHSNFSARILSLWIAPLAAFPWAASAASHSKKQTKEVYAATDNNEMQPGFAMPVDAEPGANLAAPAQAVMLGRKAKAPAAAKASASSFDTVPASQSDAIVRRIKIVENLVHKYGRAYDYRTHTLKELQLIQSTLESTSIPAAAPRAAATQSPTAVVAPAPALAPAPAPAQSSDTVSTGQAAAIENAEEVNLKTLPAPAEFESNTDAEQGI